MKQNGKLFLVILFAAMSVLGCNHTMTIKKNTTLTSDYNGTIIIGADGITLNGNGYVIYGKGSGNGIKLVSRTGVTIENCTVTNFDDGIQINESHNNTFTNNEAHNNIQEGFDIEGSNLNNFIQNTSRDNGRDGFDIGDSNNNVFTENVATQNGTSGDGGNGFELDNCSDNTFTSNTANNNALHGFSLDASPGNTFEGNTANNNTRRGFQIETSNNNIFRNNNASGNIIEDARQDNNSIGNEFCGNDFGTTDNIPADFDNPCP